MFSDLDIDTTKASFRIANQSRTEYFLRLLLIIASQPGVDGQNRTWTERGRHRKSLENLAVLPFPALLQA